MLVLSRAFLKWLRKKIIHQNSLESLAKEIYKFLYGLSPPIMSDAFMTRNNKYNLRNFQCLYSRNKRTAKYRSETGTYRGPQIWNLGPKKTKNASSFEIFKKLENWRVKNVHVEYVKGEECSCRICKTYIQHVGLIWKNYADPVIFLYIFIYIFIMLFMWGVVVFV